VTPDLPANWGRRFGLFELGFVFLLLPLVVATMDRPPLHLGGLLLLWICALFLARSVEDIPPELARRWNRFRWWTPVWVGGLAACGAWLGAGFQGMVFLTLHAVLFSLPAAFLAFHYAPRRFADADWMPRWLLGVLPALSFAGLHVSTLSWKAAAAALLGGLLVRRFPLSLQSGLHAVAWAAGSAWRIW
jgi:hypothetical protein